MYKIKLHKIGIIACMIMFILGLSACSQPQQPKIEESQGGFVKIAPGAYDSADTAIVLSKQEKAGKITFLNMEKKRNYTLNYDGTTKFVDKYGSQIAVSQLEEGEIVEVQFLKEEKLLSNLSVASDIWTYDGVSKFELDLKAGRMKFMDEYYTLEENTVVISDKKQVEFIDIHPQDSIKIKGKDHKIYSISIETGHGYLRLLNSEYFIGGWIEVGQKVIQKIEEDMLLVVPEGKHSVYLSHSGIEGTKEVEIVRNQETQLDIGDLKTEDLIKYGNLIFTVDPEGATVSIDGKRVDTSRVVKATYGLHQIMAKADGYDTVIQYIRVNENNANVAITLEEEKERSVSQNTVTPGTNSSATDSTNTSGNQNTENKNQASNSTNKDATDKNSSENNSSGSSVSDNNLSGNDSSKEAASTGYKVTIESPTGAEVYVDGSYVGIVPISFAKKSGSHEVTVRKSGYMTRTYTIDVDNEEKDISYSFSDLTPIE